MLFKLNSYRKDSSTGHSVYQFTLSENEQHASSSSAYDGYYDESYGISPKGMQTIVKKLAQIKMEAFTIKQLLN